MRPILAILVAAVTASPFVGTVTADHDPVHDVDTFLRCYEYLLEDVFDYANVFAPGSGETLRQAKCKLKLRPGIVIDGDSDLYVLGVGGVVVPNRANGVVGGTGSYGDPFLIMGHEFHGQLPQSCPAISISGTTSFVKITGNWFHDGTCEAGMIAVRDAPRITIEGNRFSRFHMGITAYNDAYDAKGITVSRNLFEEAYYMEGVLRGGGWTQPLRAYGWNGAGGLVFNDNKVYDSFEYVSMYDSIVTAERNSIIGGYGGLLAISSTGSRILIGSNTISGYAKIWAILGSHDASNLVSISYNNLLMGATIRAGSHAGTIRVAGNYVEYPYEYGIDVEADCYGGLCATATVESNTVHNVGWADPGSGIQVLGQGTIRWNSLYPGSGGNYKAGIQFLAGPSSNAWNVHGNTFGHVNAEFKCDSFAVAITNGGNTYHDGALTKNGCA